jgi:hypothetical protein
VKKRPRPARRDIGGGAAGVACAETLRLKAIACDHDHQRGGPDPVDAQIYRRTTAGTARQGCSAHETALASIEAAVVEEAATALDIGARIVRTATQQLPYDSPDRDWRRSWSSCSSTCRTRARSRAARRRQSR